MLVGGMLLMRTFDKESKKSACKMKKFFAISVIIFVFAFSQANAQLRLNGGIDILKTPFFKPFPSVQVGLELAYFLTSSVAFTGGFEAWQKPEQFGGSLGLRFYPVNPVFMRMRGIISSDSDFSLGLGYAIPINRDWRVEIMSDYYIVNEDFAIRLGMGYKF